jgi:cytochrome c-type biogenesis protein
MDGVSIIAAFFAGLVSFLAPCVLPIIPGFLSYLGGSSVAEARLKRKEIFLNSLYFVLGFSVVFALLGVVLNTVLSAVAYDAQAWLSRIGGAIIIFFGLYLTGLVKISLFEREYRIAVRAKIHSRSVTSFLFGLAFAVGWTPCVGPALGVILGLAASHPGSAFVLLLVYAIGLGIPFLLVGLFVAQASALIARYAHVVKYINIVFGVLLIVLGALVFTQSLNLIASWEFLNLWLLR